MLCTEIVDEGESGGEDEEEEGARDGHGLKAQQAKLEAERQAILQNKELLQEASTQTIHWVYLPSQ